MQELSGYVKIHRKLIRWGWYKNSVIKDTFLHCIFMANFSDQPFEGIVVKKGEFVTSYENLASDLGFSVQQIRTALKKLKSTGELTTKSTNKFTLVRVVNWEQYQILDKNSTSKTTCPKTNEQQTSNNQITNKQQSNNNNVRMIKNDKNEKKYMGAALPSGARQTEKQPDWVVAGFSSEAEHKKFLEDFRR